MPGPVAHIAALHYCVLKPSIKSNLASLMQFTTFKMVLNQQQQKKTTPTPNLLHYVAAKALGDPGMTTLYT